MQIAVVRCCRELLQFGDEHDSLSGIEGRVVILVNPGQERVPSRIGRCGRQDNSYVAPFCDELPRVFEDLHADPTVSSMTNAHSEVVEVSSSAAVRAREKVRQQGTFAACEDLSILTLAE